MSYIAIDIGATNIRVATGDYQGIHKKIAEPTETKKGPKGVSRQISRLIESILDEDPSGIGIGSIGPIDYKNGVITNTPNYPIQNITIREPLIQRYKVPVTIVNDCAAAVLGEQVFGDGRGLENLVYVTMSTGLGGGAIIDDNLLLGKDGNAVEVGHFTIEPDSEILCGCGCRGHWEAFCGGKNIPTYAEYLLRTVEWEDSLLYRMSGGKKEGLQAKTIFKAALEGDEHALMIVNEIGKKNAVGFANIVNAYDPELITIGGSIALNNEELLLHPIFENIAMHTINRIPEIKITSLGHDSVLIGALAIAMQI